MKIPVYKRMPGQCPDWRIHKDYFEDWLVEIEDTNHIEAMYKSILMHICDSK